MSRLVPAGGNFEKAARPLGFCFGEGVIFVTLGPSKEEVCVSAWFSVIGVYIYCKNNMY